MSFTIVSGDLLSQIESNGNYGRIEYKVDGFWSNSQITVYVQKRSYRKGAEWEITINHSAGGKEDENDLDASMNFAKALMHAVADAKMIKLQTYFLEAALNKYHLARKANADLYDEERKAAQERHEELRAAEEAVIAERAMGKDRAEFLATKYYNALKEGKGWSKEVRTITVIDYLEDGIPDHYYRTTPFRLERTSKTVQYYLGDKRVKKDLWISRLADRISLYEDL